MSKQTYYYRLNDIQMIGKLESNVPYLYYNSRGWIPDSILVEYVFLGDGDYDNITEEEAYRFIELITKEI